jgi:hypothetical protein
MKMVCTWLLLGLAILYGPSQAADRDDWRKASAESKKVEIARILGNINSKVGCRVKLSVDYYVRQLNDFYISSETKNITVSEALSLIATGAGEDWCPNR